MSAPIVTISPEQAQAMLRFLSSSQIIGQDAPLFMECVFALQMIATHKDETPASPQLPPEPGRTPRETSIPEDEILPRAS